MRAGAQKGARAGVLLTAAVVWSVRSAGCRPPGLACPVAKGDTLVFVTDGFEVNLPKDFPRWKPRKSRGQNLERHCRGNDDALALVVGNRGLLMKTATEAEDEVAPFEEGISLGALANTSGDEVSFPNRAES